MRSRYQAAIVLKDWTDRLPPLRRGPVSNFGPKRRFGASMLYPLPLPAALYLLCPRQPLTTQRDAPMDQVKRQALTQHRQAGAAVILTR